MTIFNPQNKPSLTYGEALDPIFKITDKQDALQYKKAYIEYTAKFLDDPSKAENVVNANIGYWAGYGSLKDRERIEALFDCSHPVFGKAEGGM